MPPQVLANTGSVCDDGDIERLKKALGRIPDSRSICGDWETAADKRTSLLADMIHLGLNSA